MQSRNISGEMTLKFKAIHLMSRMSKAGYACKLLETYQYMHRCSFDFFLSVQVHVYSTDKNGKSQGLANGNQIMKVIYSNPEWTPDEQNSAKPTDYCQSLIIAVYTVHICFMYSTDEQ